MPYEMIQAAAVKAVLFCPVREPICNCSFRLTRILKNLVEVMATSPCLLATAKCFDLLERVSLSEGRNS